MPKNSQYALQRITEKYSSNIRFILTYNTIDKKLFNFTKSRFIIHKFEPVSSQDILKVLTRIKREKSLEIDDNTLNILSEAASGDVRDATKNLQSMAEFGMGIE